VTIGLLATFGEGLCKSVGKESAEEYVVCTKSVIKNNIVNKKDVAFVMSLPKKLQNNEYIITGLCGQTNNTVKIVCFFCYSYFFERKTTKFNYFSVY